MMYVKKIISFLSFVFYFPILSFTSELPQWNLKLSLNTPPAFGKTHFIVGYTPEQAPKKTQKRKTKKRAKKVGPLQVRADNSVCDVYFSPNDDVRSVLTELIAKEKEKICIAVFNFTDKKIAQSIVAAHERGVTIEILTDLSSVYDRYAKIDLVSKKGVPVFIYDPKKSKKGIMHHKFAVFGKNIKNKALVMTGSYNYTRAGSDSNQENVVILDDTNVIKKFTKQFDHMKQAAYQYQIPHFKLQ